MASFEGGHLERAREQMNEDYTEDDFSSFILSGDHFASLAWDGQQSRHLEIGY